MISRISTSLIFIFFMFAISSSAAFSQTTFGPTCEATICPTNTAFPTSPPNPTYPSSPPIAGDATTTKLLLGISFTSIIFGSGVYLYFIKTSSNS